MPRIIIDFILHSSFPINFYNTTVNNRLKFTFGLIRTFELISTFHVFEYFIAWWTLPLLISWLNRWNLVEEGLGGFHEKIKISNFYNFFYISILIAFFLFTLYEDYLILFRYPLYVLEHVLYNVIATLNYATYDINVLYMFKAIESGFHRVLKKFEHLNKQNNYDNYEIKCIRNQLLSVRKQAEGCGEFLAISQLFSILMSIYFTSATMLVTLTLLGESGQGYGSLIGQCGTFSAFSFCRLIMKIKAGTSITEMVGYLFYKYLIVNLLILFRRRK